MVVRRADSNLKGAITDPGKWTKRQRPQSRVPFSISPPIVSCPARDVIEEYTYLDSKENALGNNVENHKKDGVITSSSPSASWSSNNNPTTLKAEEDEEDLDIASCLIVLSQGHSLPHLKIPNHETTTITHINLAAGETSSSNGGGKTDSYVYQCKTCDWTFSSFQALGGHRASHKKHKATSNYSNLDHIFVYDDMYLQIIIMSGLYMLGFQIFNK
ncbi:LOW QUALITY PROTEIN: hypothetical protein HID58_056293 [Brassica napus]|uniref:C2H2-type domain-containing protein n=1 Tax=Brassica napus TaxID=3708 RepID=A0ABQ8AMT0_BRANA|nr:LOW QUALITY PROTEIN: hypothetical protein HID58_056293 [Brassica napus]